MLSLHKKIQSNWKGYANLRVPVKVKKKQKKKQQQQKKNI